MYQVRSRRLNFVLSRVTLNKTLSSTADKCVSSSNVPVIHVLSKYPKKTQYHPLTNIFFVSETFQMARGFVHLVCRASATVLFVGLFGSCVQYSWCTLVGMIGVGRDPLLPRTSPAHKVMHNLFILQF